MEKTVALGEVITNHHEDFVRTLWALSQLKACTADLPDDAIELKLVINSGFNAIAQLVRLNNALFPELASRTESFRTGLQP